MRATLTLDPDVARMIEEEVHRARKPRKQVVNEALRRGLASSGGGPPTRPYRVRAHRTTLRPGLDRGRLNALADETEDAAVIGRPRRRR